MDFTSNTSTRSTVAVSGKTQRLQTGSQYWSFSLQSPKKSREDIMSDYAFLVTQDGQAGTFTLVPPVVSSARGTMTGTMTVSDTSSTTPLMGPAAGSSAVGIVEDGTANGTLKKGDLIKFSNHDKVYMVSQDFTLANDSSVQTLEFYPPLTAAVESTTTVTYNNVPFRVYLTGDNVQYKSSTDGLYQYQIKVNEDI